MVVTPEVSRVAAARGGYRSARLGPSTRMIADAIRRHSPSSCTSSFRPFFVSV